MSLMYARDVTLSDQWLAVQQKLAMLATAGTIAERMKHTLSQFFVSFALYEILYERLNLGSALARSRP